MARGSTNEGRGPLYRLYINRLRRRLDPASVPHHLAMMIDGNRRWAKQLGYDSAAHGHRAGAAKMKEFLRWCDDVGIRVVEVGDGQVSDLVGWSPEAFANMWVRSGRG